MYVLVRKIVRGIFYVANLCTSGIACCVTHFGVRNFYWLYAFGNNYSSIQSFTKRSSQRFMKIYFSHEDTKTLRNSSLTFAFVAVHSCSFRQECDATKV